MEATSLAKKTHNPIRHIVENLNLEPNPEKHMIALSIGDPTIFGNLKPPQEVVDAVKRSIDSAQFNGYAPAAGYFEARDAVAKYSSNEYYTVQAEDVILCSGCSSSLDLCISVLAEPGKNILTPRPGFSIYKTLAGGLGAEVREYNLIPQSNWEVDLFDLESKIDENTVAIVVTNPSNPCGSVYSSQHLKDILDVASRNCVPIIADEIYEHLVFKGETFYPIAAFSEDVPILSCSGLTKRFLCPGWRMGWIVIHDRNSIFSKEIRNGLQRLSSRILGSNTLVQGAIPEILTKTPQSFFDETIGILQRHAQIAYSFLSEIDGLIPVMPQGAMYMMIKIEMERFPKFRNGLEFVKQMVQEESVFCLPGECFDYPGYMRIVLTTPEEQLLEACTRMSKFCERHFKSNEVTRGEYIKTPYQNMKYVIPLEQGNSTSP